MAGHNVMRNRMTTGRAIISALALVVVFCGMAGVTWIVDDSGGADVHNNLKGG